MLRTYIFYTNKECSRANIFPHPLVVSDACKSKQAAFSGLCDIIYLLSALNDWDYVSIFYECKTFPFSVMIC